MDDKQKTKQTNKLFCAPILKKDDEGQSVKKNKFCIPSSINKDKPKDKHNEDDTYPNDTKIEGGTSKQKQKTKGVSKSLTDQEYNDIFQSVLDAALHYADENIINETSSLEISSSVSVKDQKEEEENGSKTENKKNEKFLKGKESVKQKEDNQDTIKNVITNDSIERKVSKIKTKKKGMNILQPKEKQMKNFDSENSKVSFRFKGQQKTLESLSKNNIESDEIGKAIEEEDELEETGTWIQCSVKNCGKWRYVDDIPDPLLVPDNWDCSMNSDKEHNSCDAPEIDFDESEHILTKFTLGSVVWAKLDGFPWWPAMIDSDPDYDTYFELPSSSSMIPTLYHVTFLDKNVSRAWIKSHLIAPFNSNLPPNLIIKSASNRKDLLTAKNNAEEALSLDLQERLESFSFSKRFTNSKTLKSTQGKLKAKNSDRSKKNIQKQKRYSKQPKDYITDKILSSSQAMLKELDLAIDTCKSYSTDEENEDDVNECDHDEDEEKLSKDEKVEIGNLPKEICQQNKGKEVKEICETKRLRDSKIEEPGTEPENLKHGNKKTDLKNNDCPVNLDIQITDPKDKQHLKDYSTNTPKESKSLINDDMKHDIILSKCSIDENVDFEPCRQSEDLPSRKKVKTKSKKEQSKETLQSNNDSLDHSFSDIDSEKENQDPKSSFKKKVTFSLKENKVSGYILENQPDEENSLMNNKKTKLGKTKKPLKKNLFDSIEKTKEVCSNKLTNESIDTNCIGDTNELKESNINEKTETCGKSDLKDNVTKRGNKKRKAVDNIDDALEEQPSVSKDKVFKTIEKASAKKIISETQDVSKLSNIKGKSKKPKHFINPLKESINSDQNVPAKDQKTDPSCKSLQNDQSVPDISSELVETELEVLEDLSNFDFKSSNKDVKKDDGIGDDDDDELNLSLDSLDADPLKGNLIDVNKNENDLNLSPNDKNRSRFSGHCSDHGEDSDPFELIEE